MLDIEIPDDLAPAIDDLGLRLTKRTNDFWALSPGDAVDCVGTALVLFHEDYARLYTGGSVRLSSIVRRSHFSTQEEWVRSILIKVLLGDMEG